MHRTWFALAAVWLALFVLLAGTLRAGSDGGGGGGGGGGSNRVVYNLTASNGETWQLIVLQDGPCPWSAKLKTPSGEFIGTVMYYSETDHFRFGAPTFSWTLTLTTVSAGFGLWSCDGPAGFVDGTWSKQ